MYFFSDQHFVDSFQERIVNFDLMAFILVDLFFIKALASTRGSENNEEKKKPIHPESEGSCQCLYVFFMTQGN